MSKEVRAIPGQPPATLPILPVVTVDVTWTNLYTLSYVRFNAMRQSLLLMPVGATINQVVDIAKDHCKKKGCTFNHIEPAITNLSGETI